MKVTIPADVNHIFGKPAFKKTLKTSGKTVAIARSGPLPATSFALIAGLCRHGLPSGGIRGFDVGQKSTLVQRFAMY
ncbi:hypothetical protein [Roseinatronobacter domitianus]|uniref:hypothetical protein n=1 Tax=Roseinatronobacter domitianus TaxID=2940293 RepID=UPI003D169EC6